MANDNNAHKGFDEDDAVDFIRQTLPAEVSEKYSDDEILYVIDVIWDYYEKKGFLSLNDIDSDDEDMLDTEDLVAYVRKELREDKELMMDHKDIPLIVRGELQYEESLDDIF